MERTGASDGREYDVDETGAPSLERTGAPEGCENEGDGIGAPSLERTGASDGREDMDGLTPADGDAAPATVVEDGAADADGPGWAVRRGGAPTAASASAISADDGEGGPGTG